MLQPENIVCLRWRGQVLLTASQLCLHVSHGGKLLGAGGGGFMLIFAEPSSHGRIREALRDLIEVSFQTGSPGSTIVIFEPDGLEQMRRAPSVKDRPSAKKTAASQ